MATISQKFATTVYIVFSKELPNREMLEYRGITDSPREYLEKDKAANRERMEACKKLGFKGELIEDNEYKTKYAFSGFVTAPSYEEAIQSLYKVGITGNAAIERN